jgi:hypothetical protein
VGAVLAARLPRHRIARLLCAAALVFALGMTLDEYAR